MEKILIVGNGNVAWHFRQMLGQMKHINLWQASRTPVSVKEQCIVTIHEAVQLDFDLIILAVSDHAIEATSLLFTKHKALLVHTSGTTNLIKLSSKRKGVGVIYPLQSLSKNTPCNYRQLPFFIEADSETTYRKLIELISQISDNITMIDSEQRMVLHLAGVVANNFTNHMLYISEKICQTHGIDYKMLHPLIEETFRKTLQLSPEQAQTGPAVRADNQTMDKHLEILKNTPGIQQLYKIISTSIQKETNKKT